MAETAEQSDQAITTLPRMKNVHLDEQYWDMPILVDKEVSKCQRSLPAAHSKVFDTMFSSSNFEESNAKADQLISLREMDATALEQILHLKYLGDDYIEDSNVLQLLFMDDFFQLRHFLVKERCFEYLKRRSKENKPIPCAPDLLCFTQLKGENVLADTLRSHICRHLHHYYSKNAQFMNIPYDILEALLKFCKDYISPLPGSANLPLMIIRKWINHDREGRSNYRSNLIECIDFGRISSNFSRSLMNGLENALGKVVNPSKDIESLSELKNLVMGMDTIPTDAGAQFDATISFDVKNVSELYLGRKVISSSRIISNLSWRIYIKYDGVDDSVKVFLYCDGTDFCSVWNCYASATITIVSQKEKGEDFVKEIGPCLFTSGMKSYSWGCKLFSSWIDLLDPENGLVKDDKSITLVAHVHADVPFSQNDDISLMTCQNKKTLNYLHTWKVFR